MCDCEYFRYLGHPTSSSPNIDMLARDSLQFTQFYTARWGFEKYQINQNMFLFSIDMIAGSQIFHSFITMVKIFVIITMLIIINVIIIVIVIIISALCSPQKQSSISFTRAPYPVIDCHHHNCCAKQCHHERHHHHHQRGVLSLTSLTDDWSSSTVSGALPWRPLCW